MGRHDSSSTSPERESHIAASIVSEEDKMLQRRRENDRSREVAGVADPDGRARRYARLRRRCQRLTFPAGGSGRSAGMASVGTRPPSLNQHSRSLFRLSEKESLFDSLSGPDGTIQQAVISLPSLRKGLVQQRAGLLTEPWVPDLCHQEDEEVPGPCGQWDCVSSRSDRGPSSLADRLCPSSRPDNGYPAGGKGAGAHQCP